MLKFLGTAKRERDAKIVVVRLLTRLRPGEFGDLLRRTFGQQVEGIFRQDAHNHAGALQRGTEGQLANNADFEGNVLFRSLGEHCPLLVLHLLQRSAN